MLLKQVSTFDKFILLAGCLGIYVVLYKLQWTANEIKVSENTWNPGWMLFGPLLYIAMRTHAGITISRKACLHLIPAFLFTAMYGLIRAATSVHHPLANCLLYYYQKTYLVIAFSLYSY